MDLGESQGGLPPDDARRGRGRGAGRDREAGAAPRAREWRDDPDRRGAVLAFLGHAAADDGVGRACAASRPPAPHPPGRDRGGGGVLRRALRLPPGRVHGGAGLARLRRLVRTLRAPLGDRHRALCVHGYRGRSLPDVESASRRRRRAGARPARRRGPGGPRRRRVSVERARGSLGRAQAVAARRARSRWADGTDRPRGPPPRHARRRRGAPPCRIWARSSPASAPTSPSGGRTASSSPAPATRWPRLCWPGRIASTGCTWAARKSSATGNSCGPTTDEIAQEHRRQAEKFAA